jgi:16S rRNA processing protein RimM
MSGTVEVVVGVIGRAHGIRGDVAVDLRTDEPARRFAVGQQLRAEGTTTVFTVESARDHSGRLLVRFAGLADRTAVETVRGTVLVADVPADEQPSEPGEYYDRQLVGMSVRDQQGATLGTLTAVLHLPMQDLLEITTPRGARLVPFVSALVPEVDLAAGVVTLGEVAELLSADDA